MAVERVLATTNEQGLRSILDNIGDAVSVKDRDRRYQLVNRAFEQRFGALPAGSAGCRDDVILPASMLAAERESDELVLRSGLPVEREEAVEQPRDDRAYVTVKFALRDESGDVCGVCTVITDISERKRREAERGEHARWTDLIGDAIAQDRLVLHAQPIVNLASAQITQAELLVRMIDCDGSPDLIAPEEFLPAAERFELVAAIDLWVVTQALELARDHRVAINLSARTISAAGPVAEIERLVASSGAPPQNIIFEITESAIVENLAAARSFAERLRATGCSFALDDFGVGFGTFTYLKHLPVDYLKIDIEFVRNLASDAIDRHVVQAMVAVARGFGIETIAEGVEDQATLELLTSMGVDYAQGFWLGRPTQVNELWPQTSEATITT